MKYDLAVIGSGPGGYVAALHAAQKGMKVVCIEKENTLGGTCLNIGCIPSKALLHSTEYYDRIVHQGKEHGIEYTALSLNFAQMMRRKQNIVAKLTHGIEFLFKKNHVTRIKGEATLFNATTIEVNAQKIEARYILLATGSGPIALPFLPFDEKRILSSTGALNLQRVPKKILIIGAGIIGLELGSVYNRLSTQVEIIELLDQITVGFDQDISKNMQRILQKQGMQFKLGTKVISGKVADGHVELSTDNGEHLSGEVILVAIGRRPYCEGLGLQKMGIQQTNHGYVVIDQNFRTSVPNIYAIGDLVDGPMLAHKASEEAVAAVNAMNGERVYVNYLAIPNVMYTWPEVASVGMTEERARQSKLDLVVGKIPFTAVARARCSGDEDGLVKILGEKRSGRIMGLHIIGPNASEMIHEGVLAITKKMTLAELAHSSHAHPTCSEAIKEAALSASG